MRTAGIIGGIGFESTVDYYRLIVAAYRERCGDDSAPSLLINSIDLKKMLGFVADDRLPELTAYLAAELGRLAAAGADFGLLAANTPHIVFDELAARSPIPLISIVDAACRAAQALDLKRLGLLGTRFTMQGRFYADPFRAAGVELVPPKTDEQTYVHEKYMSELVRGDLRPQTRTAFSAIIARLRTQEEIDGVVLAGTELALLLRDAADPGIPMLDTTRLHVERVVAVLLSPELPGRGARR